MVASEAVGVVVECAVVVMKMAIAMVVVGGVWWCWLGIGGWSG